MNGKECRDGINIRVSALAMMIVLTCAGMGLPRLEEDQKALALEKNQRSCGRDTGGVCGRTKENRRGRKRRQTMNSSLLSSKKQDWCTPKEFFDVLDAEFHFTLDAAATKKNAKCSAYFTPEDDALKKSWGTSGAVFCNPPYGREVRKWVRKAYEESRNGQVVVMLLPARTDTSYFHDYIYGHAEIRFIRGRLRFTDENGNEKDAAPFPSMVVIYRREMK